MPLAVEEDNSGSYKASGMWRRAWRSAVAERAMELEIGNVVLRNFEADVGSWQNDGSGIDQRVDFWELVAEKVNIYRSGITKLSETTIELRDGYTDLMI